MDGMHARYPDKTCLFEKSVDDFPALEFSDAVKQKPHHAIHDDNRYDMILLVPCNLQLR